MTSTEAVRGPRWHLNHWTRWVITGSLCAAPLAHAALRIGSDATPWPTVLALVIGLAGGRRWPLALGRLLLAVGPMAPLPAYLLTGQADIQHVMVWLAAVAGWLAASGEATPVRDLPVSWAWALRTWQLTLAITWPVVAARELDVTWATVGVATPNGLLLGPPHEAAAATVLAAAGALAAVVLLNHLLTAPAVDAAHLLRASAPGLIVAAGFTICQGTVDLAWLGVDPWVRLGRAGGPLFDANSTGGLLALIVPALGALALGCLASSRGILVAAMVTGSALPAILMTGSRTALLVWTLGAGATVVDVVRTHLTSRAQRVGAVLAVVGLALALVAVDTARRGSSSTVARLLSTEQGEHLVLGLLFDRDGYGPTTVAAFRDHPLTGLGTGAFSLVAPGYAAEAIGHTIPPDNAQAWWRQVLVEHGIVGSLAPLLCLAWVVRRGVHTARHGHLAVLGPLAALGVASLVSVPVQHPVLHVLTAVLIAWSLSTADAAAAPWPRRTPDDRWLHAAAWSVAVACAVGLASSARDDLRPVARAERFGFQYGYGYSSEPEPGTSATVYRRWVLPRVVAVLPTNGAALDLRLELPDAPGIPATATVEARDGHGRVCRGDIARSQAFTCRLSGGRPWSRLEIDLASADPSTPRRRDDRIALATLTLVQER